MCAPDSQLSIDAMLAKCNSEESLGVTRSMMQTMKSTIAAFGLPMTTYEAGPSIVEGAVLSGTSSGTAGAADKYVMSFTRDCREVFMDCPICLTDTNSNLLHHSQCMTNAY